MSYVKKEINIKIQDFEGPLDLLLHLVNQYKVDIYEVPLVEVITQYLSYLDMMKDRALDLASEYLVIASQLVLIKSRRLLPTVSEAFEEETLDLEQEILSQIDEYRKYKALSLSLEAKHNDRSLFYSKAKTEILADDVALLADKNALDLYFAFSALMQRKKAEFQDHHNTINSDEFSVEDKIKDILAIFEKSKHHVFSDFFNLTHSLDEVVTVFLAMLELIKNQTLTFEQTDSFGDIMLSRTEVEMISE
ncbi:MULTISPECIES: segregation/condensation protein A [Pseudolactococcus]|uniref:Segregation and condensation protein A n=1 Tax=Pseudolactococcus piscium MKFS47 TaxID=297352 RepID=A0A0D6DX98_9LACT|nr:MULTISPECIES: segregation/condensation protein A [Lactococcus]SCA91998.1 Segregation and condensation protein A [Lactococcus piscium]MCJ1972005.1 segregation/condensation protein A [Lactococcus carnosus]MCJ1972560.1 segregation/condensation protein A [Lactococcus carnosus]MCJ1976065.1 segregation/condensation protein A [Lactococcus carnosus]MCJ1986311.1 segregation/condensation protein A [Lactococcus carnosus]